jgi:ParB/RepB/Spo0J family partition protein
MQKIEYTFELLPVEQVHEDPDQPRDKNNVNIDTDPLLASLQNIGIQEPISVSKVNEDEYLIIDGHRRFKCAGILGWKHLLCRVYPALPREDLEIIRYETQNNGRSWKPEERAKAIAKISRESHKSNKEIAEILHVSETTVSNCILNYQENSGYQKLMEENKIPSSYHTEFRKLKKKIRAVKKVDEQGNILKSYTIDQIHLIIFERVKERVIDSAKDLRTLGKIFKRAHANEDQLVRFLGDPDMTVDELKQHTLQNGVSLYIEDFLEIIAKNQQQQIPFSIHERRGLDRLKELLGKIPSA